MPFMGEHPQFPGGELSLLAVPYLNAHLPDEDLKGRGGRGVVGSEAGSGPEGDGIRPPDFRSAILVSESENAYSLRMGKIPSGHPEGTNRAVLDYRPNEIAYPPRNDLT